MTSDNIQIKQDNRLLFIDLARGIAMLTVVSGHVVQFNFDGNSANAVFSFIGSFQMPLFFFISGYVAALSRDKINNEGVVNYVKRRAVQLLVPFVIWGLVIPLFFSPDIFNFQEWFYKGKGLLLQPDRGPWFILTLFFIQVWYLCVC